MLRRVAAAVLLLAVPAGLAAPVPKPPRAKCPTGEWRVQFQNGVVEACTVAEDGKAEVAEPLRTAGGQARIDGGVVVFTFDDDRTERWTPDGSRYAVEHWCPSAAYPAATPVRGVAEKR
mgnify:CR=1 FL=1